MKFWPRLRPAILWLLLLLLIPACAARTAAGRPIPAPTLTPPSPTAAPTAAPTSTLAPSPQPPPTLTPAAPAVWVPAYLPARLADALTWPEGVERAAAETEADAWVQVEPAEDTSPPGETALLAEWVYALAAPFPTLTDEARLPDVQAVWKGAPPAGLPCDGLLVDASTRAVFEKLWGPASAFVKTMPPADLLQTAWGGPGRLWAILPFENLEPRWKVIAVDGQSPVRKDFNPAAYGLRVRFTLRGAATLALTRPLSNYDPAKLTTVMLTGVTALVRGTASLMEIHGMEYPAEYIGDVLREADILHINNEVPFWKTCPEPYYWEGLKFCSRTKYIQLLEAIGTDVIDLAGDHFQDWGPEAILFTLDLYKERGWPYYGGGANIAEAQAAARFEHHGNRIAFLGCNAKPKGYAGASEKTPGAVHCDFDQLTAAIRAQREAGYLPIVTFQHLEYYSYNAHPILEADFQRVAEAGAVIVSGSQAHQPHAMTFFAQPGGEAAFLHYGLGNLFFDQAIFGPETSQAFLDRHVFYDGRYISTELLTIMFVDNARARLMTPEERTALLTTIFQASGW